ncbi:hypothetical protein SLS53_001303 [Cytospora paraplurivora]|uniref:Uncharacterized protein n=1 Tax=Cytospora paraplurivora TaxID=2898453 RepID=A0AAN9UJD6_9PEZI
MNFHISSLSPLRPTRFSNAPLSPSATAAAAALNHQHQPPRRPDRSDDDDDDDSSDDEEVTQYDDTVLHHTSTTKTGRNPKIEVVEAAEADDELTTTATTTTASSSPTTSSGSDSDPDDCVTQDSRDVLVQRLNDLAQRLAGGADVLRAGDVGALHAQVDDMERLLSRGSRRRGSSSRRRNNGRDPSSSAAAAAAARRRASSSLQPGGLLSRRGSMVLLSPGGGGDNGEARRQPRQEFARDALGISAAPLGSPSWLVPQFQRRPTSLYGGGGGVDNGYEDRTSDLHRAVPILPLSSASSVEQPGSAAAAGGGDGSPQISSEMADRIVMEAEGLCAEMASVIASLQKRREESDHLHAVLVQREDTTSKLIHEQAARIGELEDTVAEDESELRYLKIQLRGIEAQCLGYLPRGADPELDLSIRNWKKDWTELRDRWSARRGNSFVSGDESGSSFSNLASPSVG